MRIPKSVWSSRLRQLCPAAMLACSICFTPPAISADVYKWKDADGRTHVSDRPPADYQAERLKIRHFAPSRDTTRDEDAVAESSVVMLSASWCRLCKQARSWLTQKGIAFTEYDVERDPKGKEEYKRRGGKGVPIILVGDQRMDGFSATRLEAMLAKARR